MQRELAVRYGRVLWATIDQFPISILVRKQSTTHENTLRNVSRQMSLSNSAMERGWQQYEAQRRSKVYDARFSCIGSAYDGNFQTRVFFEFFLLINRFSRVVEQVARAATIESRERKRLAETERVKLVRIGVERG